MYSVCVRSVARMVCYALRPWARLGSETMLKCLFLWWNAFQVATSVHSAHASFLWLPCGIGQTIIFSVCSSSSFFLSSPNLSRRRLDVCHTSTHGVASANLTCRSETCCMRLDENTGCKIVAKNCHLGTIAKLCRAISPQLRHVSTIGKKLVKQQYLLHMSPQYGELRPTSG